MLTPEEQKGKRWVNTELCQECGGACCQKCACDSMPSDFDNDIECIKRALSSGKYTIDFARRTTDAFVVEGRVLTLDIEHIISTPEEALYVRPRNQHRPIVDIIHTPQDEGPCVFWSLEKGCELPYEKRPFFGRALLPIAPNFCMSIFHGKAREMLETAWSPYARELYELAKIYFPDDWWVYKELNFKL